MIKRMILGSRFNVPLYCYISILLFCLISAAACTTLGRSSKAPYRIQAGGPQSCIFSAKKLWCWGWNFYGTVGDGSSEDQRVPKELPHQFEDLRQVSLGTNHACALDNGKVFCWGWNKYGQVGLEATPPYRVLHLHPVELPEAAIQISAQGSHSCALLKSKKVYCWGKNFYQQAGSSSDTAVSEPNPVKGLPDGVEKVLSHYHHSCALAKNELWCWGWNRMGQLGHADFKSSPVKVDLPEGKIQDFALGAFHTCAIVSQRLYCWGRNDLGQLGLQNLSDQKAPVHVRLPFQPQQVFAGYKRTCVLSDRKELWCAGWNLALQLGYETQSRFSSQFQKVGFSVKTADQLSMGWIHSCFRQGLRFYCWGGNRMGQLGDGSSRSSVRPVKVQVYF